MEISADVREAVAHQRRVRDDALHIKFKQRTYKNLFVTFMSEVKSEYRNL